MKLYTEEQVRKMLFDLGDVLFNNNQNGIEDGEPELYFDDIIEQHNPVELPSDEEIAKQSKIHSFEEHSFLTNATQNQKRLSFYNGAKWMRDKIGGNNE